MQAAGWPVVWHEHHVICLYCANVHWSILRDVCTMLGHPGSLHTQIRPLGYYISNYSFKTYGVYAPDGNVCCNWFNPKQTNILKVSSSPILLPVLKFFTVQQSLNATIPTYHELMTYLNNKWLKCKNYRIMLGSLPLVVTASPFGGGMDFFFFLLWGGKILSK